MLKTRIPWGYGPGLTLQTLGSPGEPEPHLKEIWGPEKAAGLTIRSAAGPEPTCPSVGTLSLGSVVPWDRGKAGPLQLRPHGGLIPY